MKTYVVNEVFYSLQGEGIRAGTANVFVRFSGCNMRCSQEEGPKSPGGFDCDTEFESGRKVTLDELLEWVLTSQQVALGPGVVSGLPSVVPAKFPGGCDWLILTGGEPGLQVDQELCDYFHDKGYKLAIETNGSVLLPHRAEEFGRGEEGEPLVRTKWLLDWITVSPKVAEHAIRQKFAHEVKYVRGYGQAIPKTVVEAQHYLISPAFDGMNLHSETLKWCIKLCLENPKWRLSVQQHKALAVR